MKDLINKILQRWFLSEPPLFRAMCLFALYENSDMNCLVRVGAKERSLFIGMESQEIVSRENGLRRLEYNPNFMQELTEQQIAEYLKCEMIRVLLKHPYERLPDGCSRAVCALGSNILIGENYKFHHISVPLAKDYSLEKDKVYEWYCYRLQERCNSISSSPGNDGEPSPESSHLRDLAREWQEDQFMCESVNSVIHQCEESNQWGSMGGALVEKIKASAKAKINWRTVMNGFRASILSSRRRLTRMRPNRRFEFEQMGSIRQFDTKLLVALDVSGSVSNNDIAYFLGVINSSFRYGIERLDVIQFDAQVTVVLNIRKAISSFSAVGRGGTDFQPSIDYAVKNGYDGLIIFTDGYAPQPVVPHHTTLKIAWVCTDEESYNANKEWMEKTGRVCVIDKN